MFSKFICVIVFYLGYFKNILHLQFYVTVIRQIVFNVDISMFPVLVTRSFVKHTELHQPLQ